MTAPIQRGVFFARVRTSGVFGPTLSQTVVNGLTGILDAWEQQGWPLDLRFVAYTIATAWHEARLDLGIREVGRGIGHPYGKPAGPYGLIYYGRGPCQLTWYDNYVAFGKLLGIDLAREPDRALEPLIGAAILVIGSRDGLFRHGKSLAAFFSATRDDPTGARDIINGDTAKNGAAIARYHRIVLGCLEGAMLPAGSPIPVGKVETAPLAPPPAAAPQAKSPASPVPAERVLAIAAERKPAPKPAAPARAPSLARRILDRITGKA